MIEVLAIAGGLGTAGALVAVVVMAFRLSAAKDAVIAKTAALAELKVQSDGIQAGLMKQRDEEHTARAAAEQQLADEHALRVAVEMQRDELSAKVARLAVKLAATLPVSEEGAAAVNDLFATRIVTTGEK